RFGGRVVGRFLEVVGSHLRIGLDVVGSLLLRALVAGGERGQAKRDSEGVRDLHGSSPLLLRGRSLARRPSAQQYVCWFCLFRPWNGGDPSARTPRRRRGRSAKPSPERPNPAPGSIPRWCAA